MIFGKPKPKEKLGITVRVLPVYTADVTNARTMWKAFAIYNGHHFSCQDRDKKYAIGQVETGIRAQIAFDNLKEEVVEI